MLVSRPNTISPCREVSSESNSESFHMTSISSGQSYFAATIQYLESGISLKLIVSDCTGVMSAPITSVPVIVASNVLIERLSLPDPHVGNCSRLYDGRHSADWNNLHGEVYVQLVAWPRTIWIVAIGTSYCSSVRTGPSWL
jgi:hypothetical protein